MCGALQRPRQHACDLAGQVRLHALNLPDASLPEQPLLLGKGQSQGQAQGEGERGSGEGA